MANRPPKRLQVAETKLEPQAQPARPLLGPALQHIVQFVAISAPVLYGVGRTYADGFWNTIGLSASLLGYSVDDYLYLGFVAALEVFNLSGPNTLSTMLLFIGMISLISILNVLFEPKARKMILDGLGAWIPFHAMATAFVLGAILIWAVAVGVSIAAYKLGEHRAEFATDKIKAAAAAERGARVTFRASGANQFGLLMECSEVWCVVYGHGDFLAVRTDEVVSIDHEPIRPRTSAEAPGNFPRP